MSYLSRIQKKLAHTFGERVQANEANGSIVLTGSLERWEDVVRAGQMAAKKPKRVGLVNDISFTGAEIPPMRVSAMRDLALDRLAPDVLIIGGGVIGCAIARELTRYELSIVLCEKEHDVALQASSRNDGMIHPGIDLLPGKKKRRYNRRGNRMYDRLCAELDVPFFRNGQYLCVQHPIYAVAAFFSQIYFWIFGPFGYFIGAHTFRKREPNMSKQVRGALFFPSAGVVSPYGLTIALAENAADNGARIALDAAILNMQVENSRICAVQTNRGTLYPRVVINAAGVFSDEVARMAHDQFFSIHPRRGTNSILDSKPSARLNTIASTLGTSSTKKRHTKGGGLVKTVDGNMLVGPDAFETWERENFSTNRASIVDTFAKQKRTDPALSQQDVITYFTGIRAATYEEDFVVEPGRRTQNIVHAAGIQSPGLTAAPAIAADVAKMALHILQKDKPVSKRVSFCPTRRAIPRMAELDDAARERIIQADPDFGEIVCRCEQISRGEIKAALHRSVPCDSIDGVKRRVRAGMGRCQGGFCGPAILRMIAGELGIPLESVKKSGEGSELLFRKLRETDDVSST